jgi:hypothetical protein
MEISWVTMERWAREKAGSPGTGRNRPYRDDAGRLSDGQLLEKLSGFGIRLDRGGLEALCQDAYSAQEVASQLTGRYLTEAQTRTFESDWIWLAVLTLWQRWWPGKPCLETLDDKIQDGYEILAEDAGAATDRWLDAWSEALHLCDATGITTIAAFDDRFPMTQSLYNWSQDLEMELGNAGGDNPAKLRARITVGQEVMRRFTDCDQLMIENWRRAIAEAWSGLGETGTSDELYRGWLDADPAWGFGWIGWASCYMPAGANTSKDYQRAETLLHQGYAVSGVRDRDAVADWLQLLCEETDRPGQARDFAAQAAAIRAPRPPSLALNAKVGRNQPCPCGSGSKYKKCCLFNQPRA